MAEDHRPPRSDVVDQAVPIDVGEPRAVGSLDEKGCSTDGSKRARRAIHTSRNQTAGFGKIEFTLAAIQRHGFGDSPKGKSDYGEHSSSAVERR